MDENLKDIRMVNFSDEQWCISAAEKTFIEP
jgi:hypothetical protein